MVIDFLYWFTDLTANNLERIIVAVIALIGITLLGLYQIVDSQAVVAIYSSVVGFMLGHKAGEISERGKLNNK